MTTKNKTVTYVVKTTDNTEIHFQLDFVPVEYYLIANVWEFTVPASRAVEFENRMRKMYEIIEFRIR